MKCYLKNLIVFENKERNKIVRYKDFKNTFVSCIVELPLEQQIDTIKDHIETYINRCYEIQLDKKMLVSMLLIEFSKK